MEVTRTVCGSLTKRVALLYTTAWENVLAFFFFYLFWLKPKRIILTYCSSSHRWCPRSPLSGCTCWSWRCSLHLGTGIDRLSTAWLTNTRGGALIGPASENVIDCRRKELLKCKHSTHCYRRFHQSCLHSRPACCTRNYGPHSGRSHTACSLSCTHGWLRTR